ncbi:MAG: YjbH domain-containing protein, partial [Proteobacteria bacterium]|nr:YjbH domain-containing protein [Pseudomonadota bacterium]
MNFKNIVSAFALSLLVSMPAHSADYLSPNGYSGLGLIPGATTLSNGTAALTYDKTIPGTRNVDGYNYQLGLGLYENLELVGRLATNDLKCNMFQPKTCPANNIRDFSASIKWALPISWLKNNQASLALGFNDVGGAASYFKSYYLVGSKSFDDVEVTLGKAQAVGDNAMLRGTFGAIAWQPFTWSKLSLERIDGNGWAHAGITVPVSNKGVNAWITLNRRLNDAPITEKQWVGFGISMPLDRVERPKQPESARTIRLVRKFSETEFLSELKKSGFANPKLGKTNKGKAVIEVESTSYQWNILDAAGVALGVIAGAYGSKEQEFDLIVTTRGIKQLLIRGDAACIKKWLESDEPCYQMQIKSLNSNNYVYTDVTWDENHVWYFRPELILSPTLVSTWATEYGAFDIDMGVHANVVVPLWQGAYWDFNHTYPVDVTTKNFEKGGPFYASRMQDVTSRRMLHQ